jgi:hypothetical protein
MINDKPVKNPATTACTPIIIPFPAMLDCLFWPLTKGFKPRHQPCKIHLCLVFCASPLGKGVFYQELGIV